MITLAERREEIVEAQMPDTGELEFQQRRLPRIRVDSVDTFGSQQGVIEHVAAGAGDDEQVVLTGDAEHLTVDGGIFPARVVNERA